MFFLPTQEVFCEWEELAFSQSRLHIQCDLEHRRANRKSEKLSTFVIIKYKKNVQSVSIPLQKNGYVDNGNNLILYIFTLHHIRGNLQEYNIFPFFPKRETSLVCPIKIYRYETNYMYILQYRKAIFPLLKKRNKTNG